MFLKNIEIKSFRKIKKAYLNFDNRINILIGKNGQGKTTFLESIYFTSFSKSYKTNKDKEIINFNEKFAKVQSIFYSPNSNSIKSEIVISDFGRKIWLDSVEQKKLSNYIGKINAVMFSNDDNIIIKGSPKNRRKFLDLEIGQIDKMYLIELLKYNKLLKQRNALLKNFIKVNDYDLLDIITKELIKSLIIVTNTRKKFLIDIQKKIQYYMDKFVVKTEAINLSYDSTIPIEFIENKDIECIFKIYKKNYEKDILYKMTTLGLHRDDFNILINGEMARNFASGGQLKSILIALKLAIVENIAVKNNKFAIILLDDIFSELDNIRQKNLFDLLPKENQIFISTTSLSEIDNEILENASIFNVLEGEITSKEKGVF